jgi:ribonuclease BN (tRNA processing enzyme)
MSDFRFLPLGVGNAFSARYYSSSLALHAEGHWLLIDCPHPIRKLLSEASQSSGVRLDVPDLFAVVLTHLHGDHSSGLETLGFYYRYAMNGQKAKIYTHPDVSARLWPGLLSGSMEWSITDAGQPPVQRTLTDFFELHHLHETLRTQAGPFTIECRRTLHSVPTTALRIHAAGRTLGLSADTAFDPDLITWLAEADLIIHETGEHGLHTPYDKLVALPENIRGKIRLIHYADDFDLTGSIMAPLRQGEMYHV